MQKNSKNVVALCVGHSRRGDRGACNTNGVTEHRYNQLVAQVAARHLRAAGFVVHVLDHYEGNSYGRAMSWVAAELKKLGAHAALELHFNAAVSARANGHEWLYWATSRSSKALAATLRAVFAAAFPGQLDRGLKPKDGNARGAGFLQKTHCPAVICEPFFGSNEAETEFFSSRVDELGLVYAQAVQQFLAK